MFLSQYLKERLIFDNNRLQKIKKKKNVKLEITFNKSVENSGKSDKYRTTEGPRLTRFLRLGKNRVT